MSRKSKQKPLSKTVRVPYGIFGRPFNSKIQNNINRWMKDGYRLVERDDHPGACAGGGYTELTFVLEEK